MQQVKSILSGLSGPLKANCSRNESAVPRWNEQELLAAFRHQQFVPYYQPKLDLRTGEPTGVEILGRWAHPELGVLLPDRFIEQMEQNSLIDRLTECLLLQSLSFAKDCNVAGKAIGLALNVSAISLRDAYLPQLISGMLKDFGLRPDQFTIEVTETVQSDRSDSVVESLSYLQTQGFQISIDDFGTGYSSLKLLSRMPFTELKIDRTFVNMAHRQAKSAAILETIVQLADKLHLRTVAEGIETEAQIELLRTLGCDVGQGFLIAHPMPQKMLAMYLEQPFPLTSECQASALRR